MTVFGPVLTNLDVEAAVIATVKTWLPDYLAEVGAQKGFARGSLPLFRSYVPVFSLDRFDEEQLPSCIVVAPGTIDQPEIRRQAANVRWAVGIGCMVSGKDSDGTRKLAAVYTAAVRTLILQKRSLGGFAEGVVWLSERYDALPALEGERRTLGAGVLQFGVDVNAVSQVYGGPTVASVDPAVPPADWPEVDTVLIDVTRKES